MNKFSYLSILSVSDEGYSRNASCALHFISKCFINWPERCKN